MKNPDDIKRIFDEAAVETNLSKDEKILNEITAAYKQTNEAQSEKVELNIWRTIMKSPITKIAAATVIAITVLFGIGQFSGGTVTFAKVIEPILNARTVSFDVALESGNQPVQRSHFLCMAPGLIRQTLSDGTVNIVDYQQKIALTLNPNDMTAKILWIVPRQDIGVYDILGQMQQRIEWAISLGDKSVERLGRRFIDGQDAIGFRVQLSGNQDYVIGWQGRGKFTVWADPETELPIRLEWYDEAFSLNTIATDIELNVDIDESMFSMEIPEGYAVTESEEEHKVLSETVDEQRIINSFREWVALSGGTFPSSVTGYSAIKDLDPNADISFIQKEWKSFNGYVYVNLPSYEAFVKVMTLMGSGGVIGQMPHGIEWQYTGKGVKIGDTEKAVFWYRPKDSETWRVIYGDLSVKDINEEDLLR